MQAIASGEVLGTCWVSMDKVPFWPEKYRTTVCLQLNNVVTGRLSLKLFKIDKTSINSPIDFLFSSMRIGDDQNDNLTPPKFTDKLVDSTVYTK